MLRSGSLRRSTGPRRSGESLLSERSTSATVSIALSHTVTSLLGALVLADTGSSKKQEYVQPTAWKKHHKLGKFTVDPALLKPPLDHWATREFSLAHVQKLARAFVDHGKTNEKGIRVIVTSPVLYAEWHGATQAQKDDMLQPGSVFHSKIMTSDLYCPTGDHTAHALVQLQASHPHEKRWFQLTKVKFFLMKGDSEDAHFARLMGNTDNERRGLQKSVDVVDMLVQLHKHHVAEKVLAMSGKSTKSSKSKRNVEYIKDRCKKWEVNEATMRALQGLGNLEGEEWAMFHQIIKGDYPSAAHNKDGSCIPLQTHSQFTSLPGLDQPLRLMLLRNIITCPESPHGVSETWRPTASARRSSPSSTRSAGPRR